MLDSMGGAEGGRFNGGRFQGYLMPYGEEAVAGTKKQRMTQPWNGSMEIREIKN